MLENETLFGSRQPGIEWNQNQTCPQHCEDGLQVLGNIGGEHAHPITRLAPRSEERRGAARHTVGKALPACRPAKVRDRKALWKSLGCVDEQMMNRHDRLAKDG
jgi:hypothetical protein